MKKRKCETCGEDITGTMKYYKLCSPCYFKAQPGYGICSCGNTFTPYKYPYWLCDVCEPPRVKQACLAVNVNGQPCKGTAYDGEQFCYRHKHYTLFTMALKALNSVTGERR